MPVDAQHLLVTSKPTGDAVVRMGGADGLRRNGGERYLHIQMPLDLITWSGGNGPEWLPSLLGYNKTTPTAIERGALLHLQGGHLRRKAITMRIGAADVGVTIEKPTGLRELHVDADGIVLDGVNLTVACADFAASGHVSHAAVRDATLHAPLACASVEREGDTTLTVAKAGSWGHIVFEDLVDINSTVVISRPDHTCTLQANAPFFIDNVDLTGCMKAVFETMRTPEPTPDPAPVTAPMEVTPPSEFSAGAVWWNGKTGNWQDPSIWNGGDVNNASEVFLCPLTPSNGTVFVRNGSTRANGLTICKSSSDTDTLVIEGDLCIGKDCP
jgi:hypothetical protein